MIIPGSWPGYKFLRRADGEVLAIPRPWYALSHHVPLTLNMMLTVAPRLRHLALSTHRSTLSPRIPTYTHLPFRCSTSYLCRCRAESFPRSPLATSRFTGSKSVAMVDPRRVRDLVDRSTNRWREERVNASKTFLPRPARPARLIGSGLVAPWRSSTRCVSLSRRTSSPHLSRRPSMHCTLPPSLIPSLRRPTLALEKCVEYVY